MISLHLFFTFKKNLSQDLLIVNDCNVFYAAKRVNDIQFVLKPKETQNNGHSTNNNRSSESKFFTFASSAISTPKPTPKNQNKFTKSMEPSTLPPKPTPNRPASWDLFRNILS
jgi:hypothetical protein